MSKRARDDTNIDATTDKKAKVGLTPIADLSPKLKNWTIKARVIAKGSPRTWSNNKGSGQLSSVDLMDSSGSIRATMFNEASKKLQAELEEGKVYVFSKGTMRAANPSFNTLSHAYELTLSSLTQVTRVDEDASIPLSQTVKAVPINRLCQKAIGAIVDVMGIVIDVEEPNTFTSKKGKQITRRRVTLLDQTSHDVDLTLWGDLATQNIKVSTPLAFTNCKVSDYGECTLSSSFDTKLVEDQDLLETVHKWYLRGGPTKIEHLSSPNRIHYDDPRTQIKELKEMKLEGEVKIAQLTAVLNHIPVDVDSPPWYKACPDCNRKVVMDDQGYFCEACSKVHLRYTPRYILNVQLLDPSGVLYVTLFDNEAKRLIGKEAQEVEGLLKEDKTEEFSSIFEETKGKEFLFKIKSLVQTTPDGEDKVRHNVMSMVKIDPEKELVWQKKHSTLSTADKSEAEKALGL